AIAPTPNTVTAIIRAVRNRFSASCWISTERGRSSLEIGIVQPKLTASSCRFNDRREEFYETHIFVPGHQPCRIDHPVGGGKPAGSQPLHHRARSGFRR